MDTISIKAYGKVNLGLDVTGKRPDGYHLVRMIMQRVDVYDTITVERQTHVQTENADPMPFHISLTCDCTDIPADERNLAYKAAAVICRKFKLYGDIRIHIEKRIPVAAGMAGGSADGAAVIEAMDQLFRLQMTQADKDNIALSLGADVPFCLREGTWLAEGIGEKLTRTADLSPCTMVIVKPDISVSTAWAYQALDEYMDQNTQNNTVIHPDIEQLVEALKERDITRIAGSMGNILETAVIPAYPVIQDIKDSLIGFGAVGALMSGSGPTVFGIFEDGEKAQNAYSGLRGEKYDKFKVEF